MQIIPDFLHHRGVQAIFKALAAHETYIVGGAIRDRLLGKQVKDIDFATSAPPDIIMKAAQTAHLKALPLAFSHGTITLIYRRKTFQVTSFRRDIKTDGRHAWVRFGATLAEDAQRRDFTINALYLDAQGYLRDPVNGLRDLEQKKLRFIGDPQARLKEDWLRTLRYFRFFAAFGLAENACPPRIFDALQSAKAYMKFLSKQRIHTEFTALLSAENPYPALSLMQKTSLLSYFLPKAKQELNYIKHLVQIEKKHAIKANPLNRLAILTKNNPILPSHSLAPTRAQSKFLRQLTHSIDNQTSLEEMAYLIGTDQAISSAILRAVYAGTDLNNDVIDKIVQNSKQIFPLKPADLFPYFEGVTLGRKLKTAKKLWIDSHFLLTGEEILAKIKPVNGE